MVLPTTRKCFLVLFIKIDSCGQQKKKKLFGGYELEAFLVKDSPARLQPDCSDIKNTNIGQMMEPS